MFYKAILFCSLLLLGLSSCSTVDVASFPPEIQIDGVLLNGVSDLKYTSSVNKAGELQLVLDSVSLGDTVYFSLRLQAFYHTLSDFQILYDTASFNDLYDNIHLAKVLNLTTTELEIRKFKYRDGFKFDDFLVAFIPKKSNAKLPITLLLNSNVVFDVKDLSNADKVMINVITRK